MSKMMTLAETREFCETVSDRVRLAAAILIAQGDQTLLKDLEAEAVSLLSLLGTPTSPGDMEVRQAVRLAGGGAEDGLFD